MREKSFSFKKVLFAFAALLSGCGTAHSSPQETPLSTDQPVVQKTEEPSSVMSPNSHETDDFTASLIRFIEDKGQRQQICR